jgi:hypothetical protein
MNIERRPNDWYSPADHADTSARVRRALRSRPSGTGSGAGPTGTFTKRTFEDAAQLKRMLRRELRRGIDLEEAFRGERFYVRTGRNYTSFCWCEAISWVVPLKNISHTHYSGMSSEFPTTEALCSNTATDSEE